MRRASGASPLPGAGPRITVPDERASDGSFEKLRRRKPKQPFDRRVRRQLCVDQRLLIGTSPIMWRRTRDHSELSKSKPFTWPAIGQHRDRLSLRSIEADPAGRDEVLAVMPKNATKSACEAQVEEKQRPAKPWSLPLNKVIH